MPAEISTFPIPAPQCDPRKRPSKRPNKAVMKNHHLILTLTLTTAMLLSSGCSSSGTNKGTISTASIGAMGAYGSGALPARTFSDTSGSGFIVSEHSVNRRQ